MPSEERDHNFQKLRAPPHNVTIQVFFVVIVPLITQYLSHSEELTKLVQTRKTACALRDCEFVSHLIAGLVAFSLGPARLPDEPEGEASFSVYKTNNPSELNQPFLLISCTGRIVTERYWHARYRQILRLSSIWPDAHRTVTDAGGSDTLGPFTLLRPIIAGGGIGYPLCVSPRRSDCIISADAESGVQSLRVPDRRSGLPC